MDYFLNRYMDGAGNDEFFRQTGIDPIRWILPVRADEAAGCRIADPSSRYGGIVSDSWRISREILENTDYFTEKFTIETPGGTLTTVRQSNEITSWLTEHLIKQKKDIEIMAAYMPVILCDAEKVREEDRLWGEAGQLRSHIPGGEIFGQPGCWQDAACFFGIEGLIMETFDDPQWVHEFLTVLQERKIRYARSLEGAPYDLIELGGGDASTTVISPQIFNDFVAPYDKPVIDEAHKAGQKVVYHTCGGMMPILEDIAAMGPDAMETFTPVSMGGDADLAEAKRRIGDKVCMIGGFDQSHYFTKAPESEVRQAVRDLFDAAGEGGGLILCPSDHFFDADPSLIRIFADEAKRCVYS